MRRSLALGSVLWLTASAACADDIGPPPAVCPRGAVATSEHAGEWCAATTCATDADCTRESLGRHGVHHYAPGPLVCRDAALCVTEEEYTLGGLWPGPPPQGTRRIGHACVDGACPAGGACETARRCVPPGSAPPPAPPAPASTAPSTPSSAPPREDGGGGCATSPARGRGALAALALVAAAALGLRSRRDRGIHARCASARCPSARFSS